MKNFIFDLDGTLIDTMDMYLLPLQSVLAKHGYNITHEETKPFFGITAADALGQIGVPEADRQAIEDEWYKVVYAQNATINTFDGVDDTLAQLNDADGVKLIVATSKVRDEYEAEFIPKFEIAKYFSGAVTASDTKNHKPAPDPILAGIKEGNGIAEDSVYVGDTINDMRAAHAAGIKFAGAMWGAAMPERLADADYKLTHPSDLLKLL